MTQNKERLQKLISQAGLASRREAEDWIVQGKVTVNGVVAKLGDKASFNDQIIANKKLLERKADFVYYLLNKPKRTVSTVKDPQGRTTVVDIINTNEKIFPIGRLDYNTTGTLILTNDGELANLLTHPRYQVKRVYKAKATRPLTAQELKLLNSDDVLIDGKPSKQEVKYDEYNNYIIVLSQGSYHHVKKLFELVDNEVLELTRLEFAGISHVGNVPSGMYRKLTIHEIKKLRLIATNKI